MHRNVLGIIGLVLIVAGGCWLTVQGWGGTTHEAAEEATTAEPHLRFLPGMMVRVGIVLVTIWAAMPERADQINWSKIGWRGAIVALVLLVVVHPATGRAVLRVIVAIWPAILILGLLLYILRPPKRKTPG